jgi:predicted DNA-binding transcriptional regulator YafY
MRRKENKMNNILTKQLLMLAQLNDVSPEITYTDQSGAVTVRKIEVKDPVDLKSDSLFAICKVRNDVRNFKFANISNVKFDLT